MIWGYCFTLSDQIIQINIPMYDIFTYVDRYICIPAMFLEVQKNSDRGELSLGCTRPPCGRKYLARTRESQGVTLLQHK